MELGGAGGGWWARVFMDSRGRAPSLLRAVYAAHSRGREAWARCRYCVRNYDAQRDESREVFLMLLRVYLKPSGNEPIQVQPALRVLTDHHSKMDPAKVCSVAWV